MSKTYITIAVVTILLLAFVGFYFYRRGKKQTTLQYLPGELPGNKERGNQVGASNDELKLLANALHSEMKGLNWFGHNMEPYKRALLLNDTDIVNLYNTFNELHQRQSGETLTQWLQGETWSQYTEREGLLLIQRLQKLNAI